VAGDAAALSDDKKVLEPNVRQRVPTRYLPKFVGWKGRGFG